MNSAFIGRADRSSLATFETPTVYVSVDHSPNSGIRAWHVSISYRAEKNRFFGGSGRTRRDAFANARRRRDEWIRSVREENARFEGIVGASRVS